jgi:hypothetical protein
MPGIIAPLLPRGRAKILSRSEAPPLSDKIPDNWAEFARLTKIRSGTKVISFNPYFYQEKLVDAVLNNYGTVVAKGRQLGCTETISSVMLWRACREPGFLGVVLSKGQADTANIAKRIRMMADSNPELIELATKNLTDLRIVGGGRILFRPATPNGVRGLESVSMLLFDEVAFIPSIDLLYTAALPATEMCGPDARIVLMSTPYGQSGFFYERLISGNGGRDLMEEADRCRAEGSNGYREWIDENGWAKVLLHWRAHPIYSSDPHYIETIMKRKQLTETTARQEYDLHFTADDFQVFPPEAVKNCIRGSWEGPVSGAGYFIGVDSSTIGGDYTVAIVGKYEKGEVQVVQMYRERKRTVEYSLEAIGKLIEEYQPLIVGVERNGVGQVFVEQLSKKHKNIKIESIATTRESKHEMITRLLWSLEEGLVGYPTSPIVDELLVYARDGEKYSAPSGYHDDTVMALALLTTVTPLRYKSGHFDLSFR